MTTRRNFLKTVLAATALPRLSWADAGDPAFLGAAKDVSGAFSLFGLDAQAQILFRVPLPARGHAAAAHPSAPEAVAFARRPGRFALVVNCVTGAVTHRFEAPVGRHFMGHGVFLSGGDILATPENNFEAGKGVLGLWDRRDGYRRIGEVDTHGIGPHDIKVLAGDRLVIANGGILTHPSRGEGRETLNLDTMQSSLVYLSPDLGLAEKHVLDPDLHLNSIRHLAVGPDGQVAFAMQWQGDISEGVPLLGLHRRGETLRLAAAPLAEHLGMKGYAGSIAFNGAGREVAITSPKGARVHRFTPNGDFVGAVLRTDVCGLAPMADGYLASDGFGGLLHVSDGLTALNAVPGLAWDNHLVSLAPMG